jgi:hypothetical protein
VIGTYRFSNLGGAPKHKFQPSISQPILTQILPYKFNLEEEFKYYPLVQSAVEFAMLLWKLEIGITYVPRLRQIADQKLKKDLLSHSPRLAETACHVMGTRATRNYEPSLRARHTPARPSRSPEIHQTCRRDGHINGYFAYTRSRLVCPHSCDFGRDGRLLLDDWRPGQRASTDYSCGWLRRGPSGTLFFTKLT